MRAPDDAHVDRRSHLDQLRMSTGNEQCEKRIRRFFIAIEKRGKDVSVQVIDGVERLVRREGERFCRRNTDDEAADQAGAARDRDCIDVGKTQLSAAERVVDRCREQRDVLTARDFRDDTAVLRMKRVLIGRHARQHVAAVAHDGGRGIIARGLNPEK